MIADEHSVWLILRSDSLGTATRIAKEVELPVPEKLGSGRDLNVFILKSDGEVDFDRPVSEHLQWLSETISASGERIRSLLRQPGNSGIVFIHVFTFQDSIYIETPGEIHQELGALGVNFEIKVEMKSDPCLEGPVDQVLCSS
ncbi:hypothetical protein [Roseibium suaedae]|uniref:hypothetical protein n=1 Tax=Roseibium suaedae TaxID=735517 RepID=UPI000933DFE2|nr:hypothetical protein [Roseibium suaedae]